MQKQIDLFEQLEQTKQQLRQAQLQLTDLKKREASPLPLPVVNNGQSRTGSSIFFNRSEEGSAQHSVSKPPANERPRNENY